MGRWGTLDLVPISSGSAGAKMITGCFLPAEFIDCSLRLTPMLLPPTENEGQQTEMLQKFHHFQHLAEVYHVYHFIQRYTVRYSL